MDANALRRTFTSFFTERGHAAVGSSGLIPHHPTAPLFTNAGMNPFVPYFLGEERAPYPRATSVQKCVRLSGKHNDIDELGKTRRHITFFEMLGNFSFGDYFKEQAIPLAWELLTEVLDFDGERLWMTVHESDDEAEAIWHEAVGVPLERIQRLGDSENFWEMAETGPCGPNSEIHLDCGPEWGEAGGPAHGSGDRYVEFWNLVFIQYFRHADGSLSELPSKHVDTGAGLERWLMLIDGVPTVFDTDAIRPLVAMAESLSGKRYGEDHRTDTYLRIVGDHARTMTFLVSDGVAPSNEDRGYVLRSVIRRAIRRGYQLGIDRPFLASMVDGVVGLMGEAYPELLRNRDGVVTTIEREEERFRQTLSQGSALLETELATGSVAGDVAFKLHDTFGFPIELTQEMAEERGVIVERAGFDAAMEAQRRRAKEARRSLSVEAGSSEAYLEIVRDRGATEFTGYTEHSSEAKVVAVLDRGDGQVEVFLDRTPFYAEGGGQVGDTGTITTDTGVARVTDTTSALPGLHRHTAMLERGTIEPGQAATAAIDVDRREAIRRNHTGTHLLHWALREVLGPHVKQQGSLVAPDYLRFDFSHHSPVPADDLERVEALANRQVLADEAVRAYETSKENAEQLGAIAFFGEKYGDYVRVVEAGSHSMELCGGTHVGALGMIGPILIVSEGSIGANMRRIFALTGDGSLSRIRDRDRLLAQLAELLRATPEQVGEAVERLLARQRSLDDELKALRAQSARAGAGDLASEAEDGLVVARQDGLDQAGLRDLAVAVRDQPGVRAAVLVGTPDEQRVVLVAAVTKDSGLDARQLIGEAAKLTGGGGGGKDPTLAMAGGRDVGAIDAALARVRSQLGLGGD